MRGTRYLWLLIAFHQFTTAAHYRLWSREARSKIGAKLDWAVLTLDPEHYKNLLTDGMRFRFNLVLPADGDEVVRFGVHDAMTDHIGTLELSANAIRNSDATRTQ